MMRHLNWHWLLALCALALADQPPAPTDLGIRLKTAVSTQTARADDPVEAIVIAGPYSGATLHGVVEKVAESTKADERSSLLLKFTELDAGGVKTPIAGRVLQVDNAREKVDDQGCIQGILASETITGRLDDNLEKLGQKYSGFADILGAVKNAVLKPASTDVTFPVGVEMTVRVAAALPRRATPAALPKPIANRVALAALVAKEPFQTVAQKPPKPSDITNLILIGSEEDVRHAFAEAGWAVAASLTPHAKFETLRALAEDRGYDEAPVSILLLDGRPPDLVFEKTTDTFARRHHLRVWLRPATFQGAPVWGVAATHDTGINFSDADRTFIHRIDSQIDRERAKVTDDLVFTGRVKAWSLVERQQIPQHLQNATGDAIETDGKVAVLLIGGGS